MPEIKRCPALDVSDFYNSDLASIWYKLDQILNVVSMTVSTEIVAAAGGGQGGATITTAQEVLIDVVNVAGDGVLAKKAIKGIIQTFKNRAGNGNDCNVYPFLGDDLGNGVDIPFDLADGNDLEIVSFADGTYNT